MAIKFRKATGLVQQQSKQQAPLETLPEQAWRNIKSAGARAGETLETLAMLPLRGAVGLTRKIAPQAVERDVLRLFEPEPPRGATEDIIQGTLAQLPFMALGGANLLGSGGLGGLLSSPIARAATGQTAGVTAKELGFGKPTQIAAQILGSGIHGRLTRPSLAQKAKEAYAPIKESVSQGTVASKALQKPLQRIELLKDAAISPREKNVLQNIYDSVTSAKSGTDKWDLRKLFESRSALSKAYKDLDKAGLSHVATDLRQGINEVIKGESAKLVNTKFWNALSEGDKFKIAENIRPMILNKLQGKIEKLNLPSPIEKTAGVITTVLGQAEKFGRAFTNPTWRQYWFDLLTSVEDGKTKDIAKAVNNIGTQILSKIEAK